MGIQWCHGATSSGYSGVMELLVVGIQWCHGATSSGYSGVMELLVVGTVVSWSY